MATSENNGRSLADIFQDASSHQLVAGIIREHLTNKKDIREEALNGLDLSKVRKVLDLGCGFGFFTEGLKQKALDNAEVTGIDRCEDYADYFLKAAAEAGLKGSFEPSGIKAIRNLRPLEYDLVLCSYALYFFPEFIPDIARVLKDDGQLIIITHSCPHMKEFTSLVKEVLNAEGVDHDKLLPYESLINNFCDHNGHDLLSPYFGRIFRKEYRSEIIFNVDDFVKFREYFRFKYPFFLPSSREDEDNLTWKILEKVGEVLDRQGSLHITKDDTIFVCSKST